MCQPPEPVDTFELAHRGIREVASDRERGASQLARRCLEIMVDYARAHPAKDSHELADALQVLAGSLRDARPSMAALRNLVDRFLSSLPLVRDQPLELARTHVISSANKVAEESRQAVTEVSRHATALVDKGQKVITHSLSSTLLAVFRSLVGRSVRAVITESCPLREGLILAQELSRLNIDTEYITDAQMGIFAARSDLALVGADTLLRDGSIVNKAGTYLLALAAHDAGIPFYVCCESFKCADFSTDQVMLEEMSTSELSAPQLPHVHLRNVYFDITPARLITALVTEHGVLSPTAHGL
jgi:translation initiation factor eIF-2B subunit delta